MNKSSTMSNPTNGPKYQGYAALSRFMTWTSGFMVFRNFGDLHVRNILYLQDEISVIEEKLRERDLQNDPNVEHGSRRRDPDPLRRGLMGQLRIKLKEYGM